MTAMLAPPMQRPQAPVRTTNPVADVQAEQAASALLTDEEFRKLKERVTKSYENLLPQRNNRLKTLRQYIGNSLGTTDLPGVHSNVVNPLEQMVEAYVQKLISGNPQCLIQTNKLALKANCRRFQLSLNHVLRQMHLQETMHEAVKESLFSMLIIKVGVENPDYTQRTYPFDVSAMPFADPVWFEDFVFDTSGTRLSECKFMGDKYRESKDAIKNDPRNDPEVAEECHRGPANAFDQTGGESAANLGGNRNAFAVEEDDVWLIDVFDEKKRLVVTWPFTGSEKPLRVEKWTGHPDGPYRIGRYKTVPNQIMPKPPAVDGAALAELDNLVMAKIGQQVSRQKVVGFATGSATADAEKVIRANDGEIINVTHPDAVRQMAFGGADQGTITAEAIIRDRASEEWGNTRMMGGSANEAPTLGQEQMLQQSASGRLQTMQQVVIQVTKEVITAIAWYLWNDPLVRVSVMDKLPNTNVEFEVQWPREQGIDGNQVDMRQGEFNDMNFDIVPYSLTDKPPAQRLQILDGTVMQLAQMAPLLQGSGVTINVEGWIEAKKQLTGVEELGDVIQMASAPPSPEEEVANTMPMKPANTTRTYDRVTKPPDTSATAMIAKLPGSGGSTMKPGVM